LYRVLKEANPMHAQIAASLRHLKQAVTHLHDARLIIEGVNKTAAQFIDRLTQGTREQIKELELLINDTQQR
jgi:ABC-type transporter Mla subunit MlaD